jgi:hypothetical protein
MKKKWTPAARAAFARKMKAARLAKRGGRAKNPKRRRRRVKNVRRKAEFFVQARMRGRWHIVNRTSSKAIAFKAARTYAKNEPTKTVRVIKH